MTNRVTLYGAARSFAGAPTVAAVLEAIRPDRRKGAIQYNDEIVPCSLYEQTWLDSGDAPDIMRFIGGG
jgi:thiamine biosynthesis protein ThiS